LGREVSRSKKELLAFASAWNRADGVSLGLAVENALTNIGYRFRRREDSYGDSPEIRDALLRQLFAEVRTVRGTLRVVLENGEKERSRLREVPPIAAYFLFPPSGIEGDLRLAAIADLVATGDLNLEHDFVFIRPMTLRPVNCRFLRAIVAIGATDTGAAEVFEEWLGLREIVYRIEILSGSLSAGLGVEVGNEEWPSYGLFIGPDVDASSHTMRDSIHLDPIITSYLPHEWGTDLTEFIQKTVERVDLGKGPTNQKDLAEESKALADGFKSFPRFPEAFRDFTGVALEDEMAIARAVQMLAYPRRNCVLREGLERLVIRVSKKSGRPRRLVRHVFDALQMLNFQPQDQLLVRVSKDDVITSFDQVVVFQNGLLDHVFSEEYEAHWRGSIFENRCRELLRRSGYGVVAGGILVSEPLVPLEVALNLWGHQKRRTDLDVLACFANLVLMIECKELATGPRKAAMPRVSTLFRRFREILYWETRTITRDPTIFERIVTRQNLNYLGIDPASIVVLPFVVCNMPLHHSEGRLPLISFDELSALAELLKRNLRELVGSRLNREFPIPIELRRRTVIFTAFRTND